MRWFAACRRKFEKGEGGKGKGKRKRPIGLSMDGSAIIKEVF
jgi:hypothetical protein